MSDFATELKQKMIEAQKEVIRLQKASLRFPLGSMPV